jgi:hypothetical protein
MNDSPNDVETARPSAIGAELPRLNLRHLIAITAFAAVALVPMRLQQEAVARLVGSRLAGAIQAAPTANEIASVIWGIASGGSLFVVTAYFFWSWRGYKSRLEPGHWIAIQIAIQWVMTAILFCCSAVAPDGLPFFMVVIVFGNFALSIGFFGWYLNLAWQRREVGIWRLAYATLALAPVAGSILGMVLTFASSVRWRAMDQQMVWMAIPHIAATSGIMLSLLVAMASDFRRHRQRHWTHWLAVSLKLMLLAAMMFSYIALMLNPPKMP